MLKLTLFKKERKKWKKRALQHVRFRIVFWAFFFAFKFCLDQHLTQWRRSICLE